VGDQLAEVEGHFSPALHRPARLPFQVLEVEVQAPAAPGIAEPSGDRDRAECRGPACLKKPALGQLGRIRLRRLTSLASITRRMPSIAARRACPWRCRRYPRPGLEVDAPVGAGGDDVVARPIKSSLPPWHQVSVQKLPASGIARPPHQLDMVDEGRAVGPLVGRGSGAMHLAGSNAKACAPCRR
jgi:hypothetical protein